jgi:hypothetical protein
MSPRIWQAMKLHWKITIAAAVLLLVLMGISLATMRIAPQKAVDAYRKSLIASGEKLEIAEVTPPPVPPGQNGADLINEAAALLPSYISDWTNLPPAMHIITPGRAIVCFLQPEVSDEIFTNSWTNVLAAAKENRPATELLRQVINFPALDFYLDYSRGWGLKVEHLGPLKNCAQRLSAEMMGDLHNSDAASATTNLCVMLALVNGEQDERLWISQLVRMSITSIATDTS